MQISFCLPVIKSSTELRDSWRFISKRECISQLSANKIACMLGMPHYFYMKRCRTVMSLQPMSILWILGGGAFAMCSNKSMQPLPPYTHQIALESIQFIAERKCLARYSAEFDSSRNCVVSRIKSSGILALNPYVYNFYFISCNVCWLQLKEGAIISIMSFYFKRIIWYLKLAQSIIF